MSDDAKRAGQFGFSFNQRRCTGCRTCEMACKDYHDLPPTASFRTVREYAGGTWRRNIEGAWDQDVYAFYVSLSCNHCSNPVCMRICPEEAVKKDDLGFVTIDADLCSGCQICILGCPYHAPCFDEDSAKVWKCDGCFDRIEQGLAPVCVDACPQRALGFGLYKDIGDHPLLVENVAFMPDPSVTQPNYAIDPCETALRVSASPSLLENLKEVES